MTAISSIRTVSLDTLSGPGSIKGPIGKVKDCNDLVVRTIDLFARLDAQRQESEHLIKQIQDLGGRCDPLRIKAPDRMIPSGYNLDFLKQSLEDKERDVGEALSAYEKTVVQLRASLSEIERRSPEPVSEETDSSNDSSESSEDVPTTKRRRVNPGAVSSGETYYARQKRLAQEGDKEARARLDRGRETSRIYSRQVRKDLRKAVAAGDEAAEAETLRRKAVISASGERIRKRLRDDARAGVPSALARIAKKNADQRARYWREK